MHKQELQERLESSPGRDGSIKLLDAVFHSLCQAINSPRSQTAFLLWKHKEWAQLVSLETDPLHYRDADAFANDYLISKFLAKYPDFRHEDLDPEGKALQTFLDCETACKETNRRFIELRESPELWAPEMRRVFLSARRKIALVLGEPDLDRISSEFGWGPGATTSTSGSQTSAYVKFKSRLDVTSNSLMMGHCCINSTPAWLNCQLQTDEFPSVAVSLVREAFNVVRGNEIVFVPKNAKTLRVIAKEPHVNSYLQRGFGREIRRLLKHRAGQDLKDQTKNQRLAQLGSLNGEFSTIDLSGASDTISTEVVRFLLPEKWFRLLDMIRSKQGYLRKEGHWIHFAKFSSMGNGCTFELESLIFWALCGAAQDYQDDSFVSVYGDDIVITARHYESVVSVIQYAGFVVNEAKSFKDGPFRESCGKDYFDGIDVRPIFLKEAISSVETLYRLANAIRRYSHRRSLTGSYCDVRFLNAWKQVVSAIPEFFKNFKIPEGFGDCGLLVNFDEACPSLDQSLQRKLKRKGWEGYTIKVISRSAVKLKMKDRHAGYTACLSAVEGSTYVPSQGRMEGCSPSLSTAFVRLAVRGISESLPSEGHHDLRMSTYPRITRVHANGWHDLGPWR
jgi:hypothetical protein